MPGYHVALCLRQCLNRASRYVVRIETANELAGLAVLDGGQRRNDGTATIGEEGCCERSGVLRVTADARGAAREHDHVRSNAAREDVPYREVAIVHPQPRATI